MSEVKITAYDVMKKGCERWGCSIPESHIFARAVANTPIFIRAYFEQTGRDHSLKEAELNIHNTIDRVSEDGVLNDAHEIVHKEIQSLRGKK